jgi:hypothetical protein
LFEFVSTHEAFISESREEVEALYILQGKRIKPNKDVYQGEGMNTQKIIKCMTSNNQSTGSEFRVIIFLNLNFW